MAVALKRGRAPPAAAPVLASAFGGTDADADDAEDDARARRRAVGASSDAAAAAREAGVAAAEGGAFADAVAHFQRAVYHAPHAYQCWDMLAQAWLALGDSDDGGHWGHVHATDATSTDDSGADDGGAGSGTRYSAQFEAVRAASRSVAAAPAGEYRPLMTLGRAQLALGEVHLGHTTLQAALAAAEAAADDAEDVAAIADDLAGAAALIARLAAAGVSVPVRVETRVARVPCPPPET